ncbi:MAG: type II CAAX endopeptidase family protein [Pseudomonadota bacterium]
MGIASSHPALSAESAADFGPDSHKYFNERVNKAQATDYQAVLALYDDRRRSDPNDVVSQIERCRFIETYAYSEEQSIASAGEDLDACRAQLKSSPHKGNVEIILYDLESASWDEDSLDRAKALIPASRSWTRLQQSRLYETLARRSQFGDKALAGSYAITAVELNEGSTALPMALERWKQIGAKSKVRRAIIAAPDSTWETIPRTRAAEILIEIGDPEAAARFLSEKHGKNDYGAGLTLARALAANGDFKAAGDWYRKELAANKYVDVLSRIEYFEFELKHGSESDALAAYDAMRVAAPDVDAIGRYRMGLIVAHPHLIWDWQSWRAVGAIFLMALATCLLPLIVIIPIHYRGLALRVRGRQPYRLEGDWTLRHAWYAFGMFLLMGNAVAYLFAPSLITAQLPWVTFMGLRPETDLMLAKMALWLSVGSAVLLIPLLRGQPVKTLLLGRWSIKRSIFVGIGLSILIKIVAAMLGLGLKNAGALGSDTVRTIQGADEAYGLFGMLLLFGVLTPIIEELVFRGVLLKAFRGQVSFVFATLVQAVAFTLMHEERESMAFLFVFALVLGWLVKRSEGLLAPIVMHAVNNLTAGLAIVGMTSMLNR